ncbi:hypothetical protein CY34DRAFT_810480, partial [Suillus luteus UH-Slu-Lm8-n1]
MVRSGSHWDSGSTVRSVYRDPRHIRFPISITNQFTRIIFLQSLKRARPEGKQAGSRAEYTGGLTRATIPQKLRTVIFMSSPQPDGIQF